MKTIYSTVVTTVVKTVHSTVGTTTEKRIIYLTVATSVDKTVPSNGSCYICCGNSLFYSFYNFRQNCLFDIFTITVITIVAGSCYNCCKNCLFDSRSSVAKTIYLAIVTSFTKTVYWTVVTMQNPMALMSCATLLILSLFRKKSKVYLLISSFHLNQ